MVETVLVLILMMLSVYVGINTKIESNFKTGYFVFLLAVVVVAVLVKLLGGSA